MPPQALARQSDDHGVDSVDATMRGMRRVLWGLLSVLLVAITVSIVGRIWCWERDGRCLVLDLRDDRAARCWSFSTAGRGNAVHGFLAWCALPLIRTEAIVTEMPVRADDRRLLLLRATIAPRLTPGHRWTHASLYDAWTQSQASEAAFLSDERSGRTEAVALHSVQAPASP